MELPRDDEVAASDSGLEGSSDDEPFTLPDSVLPLSTESQCDAASSLLAQLHPSLHVAPASPQPLLPHPTFADQAQVQDSQPENLQTEHAQPEQAEVTAPRGRRMSVRDTMKQSRRMSVAMNASDGAPAKDFKTSLAGMKKNLGKGMAADQGRVVLNDLDPDEIIDMERRGAVVGGREAVMEQLDMFGELDVGATIKKVMGKQSHSALKAWFRLFDKDHNGVIDYDEFVDGMRAMNYQGHFDNLWNKLDSDGSGEISFQEIDSEEAALWASFRRWCGNRFDSPRELIRFAKRYLAHDKVSGSEDVLTEDEFVEAIPYLGWNGGFEQVLFHVVDLDNEGCIAARDLKWLDAEIQRRKTKEEAKNIAGKQAQRKAQHKKAGALALLDFKVFLTRRFGCLFRAWRAVLDNDGSMTVQKADLFKVCRSLNWKGDLRALWKALDFDGGGVATLEEFDPKSAQLMARFQEWAVATYGNKPVAHLWQSFDRMKRKKLGYANFANECEVRGFTVKAKTLASWLDWQDKKYLQEEDLAIFDTWKAPVWLTALPNPAAAEEFKQALLKKYSHYLKAWRTAMDKDNSNCCTWPEFQDAAKHVRYVGDVAGAWLSLDDDLSGFITLTEICPSASQVLLEFKAWADEEFGGVRSAFKVLDSDGSGELSYKEFKVACTNFGYRGDLKTLFECAATVDPKNAKEKLIFFRDVAFLDDWDTTESSEAAMDENHAGSLAGFSREGLVGSHGSRMLEYSTGVPGPGQYNVSAGFGCVPTMPTAKHNGAFSFTLRRPWLREKRGLPKKPGPTAYSPEEVKQTSRRKPAFSFGSSTQTKGGCFERFSRAPTPGPGAYDAAPAMHGPKFSMRPRRALHLHASQPTYLAALSKTSQSTQAW